MLQSITYYSNKISRYWTDENYYGYIYLTYDQKNNMGYIGYSTKKIEKSKKYFGSGIIIKNIQKNMVKIFLKNLF